MKLILVALISLFSTALYAEATYIYSCVNQEGVAINTVEVTVADESKPITPGTVFDAEAKCNALGLRVLSTQFLLKAGPDEGISSEDYLSLIEEKYKRNNPYRRYKYEELDPYIYVDESQDGIDNGEFYYKCTETDRQAKQFGLSYGRLYYTDEYCSRGSTVFSFGFKNHFFGDLK